MDVTQRIISEIGTIRARHADTRTNEAFISGLRRALALAVGEDDARRALIAAGEAE